MKKNDSAQEEAIDKVKELIKEIDTAMLTTISGKKLVSRPMQTQEVEFDGDLWFLTQKDTNKYQEISKNPRVNVAYASNSYVSISGTAHLVEDIEKKKELWSPVYEKFLKTTFDDPNIVLIKVTAETAEYWESGNTLKTVKEFTKKLAGSESIDQENELNETVVFNEYLD